MRVVISTSTFPIRASQSQPRFVGDLAEELSKHCPLTVLAPGYSGMSNKERHGRVDVRRFTYFHPSGWQRLAYGNGMRQNLRESALAWLQVVPFLCSQFYALRRLVSAESIDVVNSHWMIPQGLSAALVRACGCRFGHVLSVHAADVYMLAKLPFGRRLARFIVERSEFVFADGSHVRDHLDRLLDRSSEAVLQPMGAHLDLFRRSAVRDPESPFRDGFILFVGRFVEKKGTIYLLRAMPKVLERHPGLGLLLVGYGPEAGRLRQEALRLRIDRSVRFVGPKSHPEVAGYLRGCRLSAVPSIVDRHGETEGMPTVLIEAMAAGTRVVGSAVDGIPDVIDNGVNGWLCREKDALDLAEKILLALDSPDAPAIASAAHRTAAGFSWPRVAAHYLEAFRAVSAEAGRAGKGPKRGKEAVEPSLTSERALPSQERRRDL